MFCAGAGYVNGPLLENGVHLLNLHVGTDGSLGRVSLGIKGVEAAALLTVRLDNGCAILGGSAACPDMSRPPAATVAIFHSGCGRR